MFKANRMYTGALLVVLTLVAVAPSSGLDKVVNSVTGSGTAEEDGVIFKTTVAAHKSANGRISGTVVVHLDLSISDILKLITFRQEVTCVEVDGNSAWVGAVITQSNSELIPVGAETITLVRDLGGAGEDIMHGELVGEFLPEGTTCADKPSMPETVVSQGNFKVR